MACRWRVLQLFVEWQDAQPILPGSIGSPSTTIARWNNGWRRGSGSRAIEISRLSAELDRLLLNQGIHAQVVGATHEAVHRRVREREAMTFEQHSRTGS